MKLLVAIGLWLILLALIALAAVYIENRLYRKRRARERDLHRRMGVEPAPTENSSEGEPRGDG